MEGLRDHLARFRDSFLSSDHIRTTVNDMWVSFKPEVLEAIERFIPTKMTKAKYCLPWTDCTSKRLIRKVNVKGFIFVLAGLAALTLKTTTNGLEHMSKKPSKTHIGNIFPIFTLSKRKTLIPTAEGKMKNLKSFGP